MKRLPVLLLALWLLCMLPLGAYAHDVPQDRNDCSIEFLVRYNGEDIDGGTLTAVRVGYVAQEDGNYFFRQVMTDAVLEDISSPEAPGIQRTFYANNHENYEFYVQTQTVRDGKAVFSGLPTGLYLIAQGKAADGYSKLSDFLVSIPYLKDGEYQYHLTAPVKPELEREPEPTPPPTTRPPDPYIPQTGRLNWPVPVLAAAGLALFITGWVLCRKRDGYEK